MPLLDGKIIGVCSLLTSMRDLVSYSVRGDCSVNQRHDPPCGVAVFELIDGNNSEGKVDEPKCKRRKGSGKTWRQLWIKQGGL